VEVLSRIPEEVFEFAFARPPAKELRRAIRLKFRIKEDGVLFAWDVQQMDLSPEGSIKYALMGGDFLDDMGGKPFRPGSLIDMTKGR